MKTTTDLSPSEINRQRFITAMGAESEFSRILEPRIINNELRVANIQGKISHSDIDALCDLMKEMQL